MYEIIKLEENCEKIINKYKFARVTNVVAASPHFSLTPCSNSRHPLLWTFGWLLMKLYLRTCLYAQMLQCLFVLTVSSEGRVYFWFRVLSGVLLLICGLVVTDVGRLLLDCEAIQCILRWWYCWSVMCVGACVRCVYILVWVQRMISYLTDLHSEGWTIKCTHATSVM
jgi:hypothetical protein